MSIRCVIVVFLLHVVRCPSLPHACKCVHLLSNFKHTDTISLMHLLFLCVEVQIGNDSLLPTALTFMMEHNVKRPTMPLCEGGRGGEGTLVIN